MRQFRVTILAALALESTWGLAAGETSEPTTEQSSNLVRPTYTPVFSSETNLPPKTVDCVPEPMRSDAYDRDNHSSTDSRSMGSKASLAQFPLMDWPLALGLEDDLCLVAYADLDRTGPDTMDFEGNIHATNGHRGLDLALLSFHQMDQGEPIFASADGTVEWIEWTKFDRNVLGPFPDQGNFIILRHVDNTFTYLMNAPDFVSMTEDSIVIIDAGAILAQRSVYFQIEATDDAGRTDTMWYHLIDVNRPLSCTVTRTGDVDVNAQITSADIIGSVNYVFKGGAAPLPCEASADVNCSGAVTSADVIYLVNYVFKGGPTPCDVCTIIPGSWACP